MAAAPREVVERLIEGVAAGRVDELAELYAEETHVTHPFDPLRSPPLRSRAELAVHFGVGETPDELRREVAGLAVHETDDPEVVVAEFEYRCTSEATGAFSIPCIFVLRVRDGLIVESRDYIDPLARARAEARLGRLSDELRIRNAREAAVRGMLFGEHARSAAALADLDGLDSPRAELERGKLVHVEALRAQEIQPAERTAFAAALEGFRADGDRAGEAEALFWLGLCSQFGGDHDAAEPLLRASYDLASAEGDALTRSYAARHLGFVAAARGDLEAAEGLLRESLELRESLGFDAGVAAAKLALAELARERGDEAAATRLLDEAAALADAVGARSVGAWIAAGRG